MTSLNPDERTATFDFWQAGEIEVWLSSWRLFGGDTAEGHRGADRTLRAL